MGSVGDCFDNAMAESWMGTVKAEWLDQHHLLGTDHVTQLVFHYVEGFYNTKRRHTALGCMSPTQYEASLPALSTTAEPASSTDRTQRHSDKVK